MAYQTFFIVANQFIPPKNGGHKVSYQFYEYLYKKNSETLCITTKANPLSEETPFPIYLLFEEHPVKFINPFNTLKFYLFARKHKVKNCILNQPFLGLVLLPAIKLLGVNWIIYVHNIEYRRFESMGKWWSPILRWLENLIYQKADFLLFISPDEMEEAKSIFRLKQEKCLFFPSGTTNTQIPDSSHNERRMIEGKHGFKSSSFLIIFFGPMSYQPNLEAFEVIINQINPILKQQANFEYKILICGGGLPKEKYNIENLKEDNIEYLGFVDQIESYIKAADVMLNPILSGGGVKTKVIEAISLNTTVVSSESGAKGILKETTGEKLLIVPDTDFQAYSHQLIQLQEKNTENTPDEFYQTYSWENSIQKLDQILK